MDPEALLKAAGSLAPEVVGLLMNLAQKAKAEAPHEQQSKLQVPGDASVPLSEATAASPSAGEARLALTTAPSIAHAGAPPSTSCAKKRKNETAEDKEEGLFTVSARA